jgi:toxin ParE1/3/4
MKRHKYSVRLLRAAEEDFNDIILYIATDKPSAAETLVNQLEKNLSLLTRHPLLGATPHEEELAAMGYRFLVVHNYLIFYTIENHIIMIHRILHGARDYLSLL